MNKREFNASIMTVIEDKETHLFISVKLGAEYFKVLFPIQWLHDISLCLQDNFLYLHDSSLYKAISALILFPW